MDKTLVALDMDGTLLNEQKTIPSSTKQYLRHLQEVGVEIAIASGRPYRAIKPYYDEIGLNGKVCCYNGGVAIAPKEHERIIWQKTFPLSLVKMIVETIGKEAFVNVLCEDMTTLYLAYDNTAMDSYAYKKGMDLKFGEDFSKLSFNPLGVIFALKSEKDRYKLTKLGGSSLKGIGLRFWDNSLVGELYFDEVNKFTAIQKIAEEKHIANRNIIAFGDADNDIEMLMRSGIGVGMSNGSENAKRYADMVSLDDNDHAGVEKTLRLLLPGI
ncbi:MAG: Cof-type HAD-IIB family hydrolase [Bacilli bacterium]|jgi:Cof subfamily protein (haloacid dehalogenase superfamily)|nr:Cof-type HAD-IIB family hydrolase [Bacilli bacterium]